MGLFGAAFGFGFVVGPALGAAFAAIGRHVSGPAYGTAWPALGAAVASATALVLVWRYLPEPVRRARGPERAPPKIPAFSLTRLRAAMTHPRLRELFILTFFTVFAFVLLEATFVYLCKWRFGINEEGTGLLFAYVGILMVIVQGGMVGRLAPRFGEMRLLAIAPFITAAGFLAISGVTEVDGLRSAWLLLTLACVPMALGHGLTGPNLNALISRQAGAARQGMTFGLTQGVASLARALGPPIGGQLYDWDPALPYHVGAALLAILGIFAIFIAPLQGRALAGQRE
jgi:MFS family permease